MSVSQEPLSIRNNNPGNLRFANQPGATQGEGGFARFETPEAGLAAMQKQIELDTQTRGLTLDRFLNKYAPPSENKTQNYINFVAKKTGLDPTKPVPAERIADVQRAMIEMEGGPRSLSYFMTTRTAEAPSPGQVASATPQATRPTVQVGGPTQLPASYRMALAANYLGDTEKDSVAEQAMKMLEEMQSEEGGSAGGFSKKMMSMLAPKETGEDPFALMAKAQEENAPKRRAVPRMPRMMAEGGEVDKELSEEDRKKMQAEQEGRAMGGLRYQLGPLTAQVVRNPQGYEGRVSTPVGPVVPYMDFDPLTGTFRPTGYGMTYGQMGPEGGYEISYDQRMAQEGMPKPPPQIRGQYRQKLDRNSEVQAGGFYVPIPGAKDVYGANVRYVQRFADGGEADAMQMTVGTVPEGKPGAAAQVAKDVVRGAQYLPYDLLGLPVDIATMAMRPFGYNVEKPVGGSEYLIEKAAQAGIADRPTGSLAETASRIGMGFVNPAAGARQIGRGIEAIESAVKAPIDRAKIRAAASRVPEDVAYDPLRERLESQGIVSLATRPIGSAINTEPEVMKLRQAVRDELDIGYLPERFDSAGGRAYLESYNAAKEKYGPQMEAIEKTLVPKLENYFTRQYGTVNDPLYQATLEGKYMPRAFYSPNNTFRWDKKTVVEITGLPPTKDDKLSMEHVNKLKELSAQGNEKAQAILGRAYDLADRAEAFHTPRSIAESLKNPQNFSYMVERLKAYNVKNPEDVIKTYVANAPKLKSPSPDDNFNTLEAVAVARYDIDTKKLLEEQAKNLPIPSFSSSSRMVSSMYPFKDLTEKTRQEIIRGKPMYQTTQMFGENIDYRDIVDYVLKAPLDKWQKMSVPELIIASHVNPANVTKPSKVARMADDGVELLPFQKIMGTAEYLPVKSKMLGDGAQWREITTKEGMRIEGGLMDHCLKKDSLGYCNRLLNKESKYFTLRDADGHPYVSIEMTKPMGQEKQDVPFNVIRQVKGYMNSKAVPAYGEEISDFLTAWENQIGVKLRPAENPDYLPEKFKPQQFGIQSPPENMAKGGMVDKPLYDRAA